MVYFVFGSYAAKKSKNKKDSASEQAQQKKGIFGPIIKELS